MEIREKCQGNQQEELEPIQRPQSQLWQEAVG